MRKIWIKDPIGEGFRYWETEISNEEGCLTWHPDFKDAECFVPESQNTLLLSVVEEMKEALENYADPSQEWYVDHYVTKDDGTKIGVIKNIVAMGIFAKETLASVEEKMKQLK